MVPGSSIVAGVKTAVRLPTAYPTVPVGATQGAGHVSVKLAVVMVAGDMSSENAAVIAV